MEPIDNFEGCGSFNADIKIYIDKKFSISCDYLKSNARKKHPVKDENVKLWLFACLAKTLNEQVGLKKSLPRLISVK